MRHNKKFNHLSRKKGHRDAMLANMTISLIMHKRIFTTLAKAKALRVMPSPSSTELKMTTLLQDVLCSATCKTSTQLASSSMR